MVRQEEVKQDFWGQRGLWEEERQRKVSETLKKSDIRYRAEVTEPRGRTWMNRNLNCKS